MIYRLDLEERLSLSMETGDSKIVPTVLISGKDEPRPPAKRDQIILLVGDSFPKLLRDIATWLEQGRSLSEFRDELEKKEAADG